MSAKHSLAKLRILLRPLQARYILESRRFLLRSLLLRMLAATAPRLTYLSVYCSTVIFQSYEACVSCIITLVIDKSPLSIFFVSLWLLVHAAYDHLEITSRCEGLIFVFDFRLAMIFVNLRFDLFIYSRSLFPHSLVNLCSGFYTIFCCARRLGSPLTPSPTRFCSTNDMSSRLYRRWTMDNIVCFVCMLVTVNLALQPRQESLRYRLANLHIHRKGLTKQSGINCSKHSLNRAVGRLKGIRDGSRS